MNSNKNCEGNQEERANNSAKNNRVLIRIRKRTFN